VATTINTTTTVAAEAAAAGPIATFVGGSIGGIVGVDGIAAVNAGLAMLGGGTVASGYFGILGGIAVLNGVGDIMLGLALDAAFSAIPENSHHSFVQLIKLKPFFSRISSAVKKDLKEFQTVCEESDKDMEKVEFYSSRLERALSAEIGRVTDDTTAYNALLLSILCYNDGDFDGARISRNQASDDLDGRRFSGAAVPENGNVSDFIGCVDLHDALSSKFYKYVLLYYGIGENANIFLRHLRHRSL